jgi:hypothetical protein
MPLLPLIGMCVHTHPLSLALLVPARRRFTERQTAARGRGRAVLFSSQQSGALSLVLCAPHRTGGREGGRKAQDAQPVELGAGCVVQCAAAVPAVCDVPAPLRLVYRGKLERALCCRRPFGGDRGQCNARLRRNLSSSATRNTGVRPSASLVRHGLT